MANDKLTSGTTYTMCGGARKIRVVGSPRRIAGGYVVTVCWASDDDATERLRNGEIHPAYREGFSWDEPILNIDGYHPFSERRAQEGK